MKHFYTFLIACCMLLVVSEAFSQVEDEAARRRVPLCHKGTVIWVAAPAVPAHLAHGDSYAHQSSTGEWLCPCPKPTSPMPPPYICPDGYQVGWYWDRIDCKWVHKECPCPPTQPQPDPLVCPDGTVNTYYWDYQLCKWVVKPCPCEPTSPPPPPVQCPDGTLMPWFWDVVNCKWTHEICPGCEQPNVPPPTAPFVCPDGTQVGWYWDRLECRWLHEPCPTHCTQPTTPPPPCPPGLNCCWKWVAEPICNWLLFDCTTGQPLPCSADGSFPTCGCIDAAGGYVPCP